MIPERIVIDASVAVAVVFAEEQSLAARRVLASALERKLQLIAPDLWLLECASACSKRVRRRLATSTESRERFIHLRTLPITLIDTNHLIGDAFIGALHWRVTPYDALYALTAEFANATLVTADQPLNAALRAADPPVRAIHVNDWTGPV